MLKIPGAYGRYTKTPLRDAADLLLTPQEDAWGYMRAPYSPRLMRLGAEIAAATYHFDFARFFHSGWMDATLQVENRLFPQVDAYYAHKTPQEFVRSGVRLRRAQSMLSPALTDVLRAMRQLVTTDTGKAVVMALPLEENRFAIAVSFMGTGRKFYDWFTNFKMNCHAGVHEGFLSTARLFDRNSERISFPRVASALGRSALTLADVLTECTQRDSRFRLFLCGHSQGGAVAQAYCHLLRTQHAVLMENVVGYTLGSPTAAGADFPENPAVYPLYHLVSADDMIPRMGACMHLGVELRFYPDPDFRRRFYPPAQDPCARMHMRALLHSAQNMPDIIELFVAALRAVMHLPDPGDARAIFYALHAQLRTLTPAMQSLGLRAEDLARLLERQLLAAYRSLAGKSADEQRLTRLEGDVTAFILRHGAQAFSRCVAQEAVAPHMLIYDDIRREAPYQAIASRYASLPLALLCTRDERGEPLRLPPPGAWYASPDAPPLLPGAENSPQKSPQKQETSPSVGNNEA